MSPANGDNCRKTVENAQGKGWLFSSLRRTEVTAERVVGVVVTGRWVTKNADTEQCHLCCHFRNVVS